MSASVPTERCSRTNVVHDGHRWMAGRWWKRERWCHGVSTPPEPWQAKLYRQAQARLDAVWDLHGKPYTNKKPGNSGDETFWCGGCRTPWPCETARLLLDEDYEPLQLVRRTDTDDEDDELGPEDFCCRVCGEDHPNELRHQTSRSSGSSVTGPTP